MLGIQQDPSQSLRYQYTKLSIEDHEIRLLTLSPGSWVDKIQCNIRIVSLDHNPVYETLSYAWGDSKDSETIHLDGYKVSVRNNLESALRHLRKPDQPLSIWVDALCINQENIAEKTHQVSMMGDIYRACKQVYIWLGTQEFQLQNNNILKPSWDSVNELPTIKTTTSTWDSPFSLAEHFANDKHYHELPGYIPSPSSSAQYHFEEKEFREIWQRFCSALKSSWWTRLWCVQEGLLPGKALVVFGHWSITWDRFGAAVRNHRRHQLGCCADIAKLMASRFVFQLDNLVEDRRSPTVRDEGASHSKDQLGVDFILRRYRHKICQDPRDKVYGLLGLIKAKESTKLYPDYSLPLKDVLINAMEAIILDSEGDLRYLTGSGFNSQHQGVPSWVRDFGSVLNQNAIFPESQRFDAYTLYNASQGTTSKAVQRSRTQLVMTGVMVDSICNVGQVVRTREIEGINEVLRSWHQIVGLDQSNTIPFASCSGRERFWRTVIGDAFHDFDNTWKRLGHLDAQAYEQWTLDFPFSANPPTQSHWNRIFLLAMRAAICGRALFTTKNGNVGLCEPTTKAGDQVWVLDGGRVPFILRSLEQKQANASEEHMFVSDCYLSGFMDGEGFQQSESMKCEAILA